MRDSLRGVIEQLTALLADCQALTGSRATGEAVGGKIRLIRLSVRVFDVVDLTSPHSPPFTRMSDDARTIPSETNPFP